MKCLATDIYRMTVLANNGRIGTVNDLIFDSQLWKICFVQIDLSELDVGRKVLIPSKLLGKPDLENFDLPVELSKQQIQEAPVMPLDEEKYKEFAEQLCFHFGWDPCFCLDAVVSKEAGIEVQPRSSREIIDYTVEALDGQIGHVENLLIDCQQMKIDRLVIHTSNWLKGKKVLLEPKAVRQIEWFDFTIQTDMMINEIKRSEEYNS